VDAISGLLMTYLVNAVWQVPAVAIVAALCSRLMRRTRAVDTHRLWVAALLLSTLLPLLSLGNTVGVLGTTATVAKQFHGDMASSSSNGSTHIFSWFGTGAHRQPLFFVPFLTWLLAGGYTASFGYSVAHLGWAWRKTIRFHAASRVRPLPDHLAKVMEKLVAAFRCPSVQVLYSAETAVPVTMGFRRPMLVLPEKFFANVTEAEFSSAICHELAHIRRHDFGSNLIYELLSLPLSIHPATAIIKDRIGQTRELVCDEMAAAHVANRAAYARSLLNIAQSICEGPSPSASTYALGLFDTNTLEVRIMTLLDKTKPASKSLRTVLVAVASVLLAVTAVAVSTYAVQIAQPNDKAANLTPFAGTWTAQFQGKSFVTLTMKEDRGNLTGTCMHTVSMAEDDQGRLTRVEEKQVQDKIIDAQVSGTNVVLSIGEEENPQNSAKFELRLTGSGAAEMRPVHHLENRITTQWWKLSRTSGGL
jgi:beta-lactamase regulating signal transducer with metallopeptidase domain